MKGRRILDCMAIAVVAVVGPLISAQTQHGTVNTLGTGTAGVEITSDETYPDVFIKTGNATTSAFRIFNSSNGELLSVTASGNVGIGTPNPIQKLRVTNSAIGVWAFHAQQDVTYITNITANERGAAGVVYARPNPGVTNFGSAQGVRGVSWNSGAGTLATAVGLYGEANVNPPNTGTITSAYGVFAGVNKYDGTIATGYGVFVADVKATNDWGVYQEGQDDSNYFAGDLTIGAAGATGTRLAVNGDASFTGTVTGGNIQAKYQDIAEWVPASSDLTPGTVVVLDAAIGNGVKASMTPYDTSVAGVVSTRPGIVLGEGGQSKEQIATTGRVRVKVDAMRAPIAVGDLLVTSDKPGYAMKSIPVDVAGIAMHRPGTIVGKALEPLASGEGEVLVLLSLH
jgi:hypothetical protein